VLLVRQRPPIQIEVGVDACGGDALRDDTGPSLQAPFQPAPRLIAVAIKELPGGQGGPPQRHVQYLCRRFIPLFGNLEYRGVLDKVKVVVPRGLGVPAQTRVGGAMNSLGIAVVEQLWPFRHVSEMKRLRKGAGR